MTVLSGGGRDADPYAGLPDAELLREVGEIVAVRMADLLPQALQRAASSLYRQAEQAIDMEKRLLNMEAGQLAQHRLTHLPADFRRHFDRRIPAACRRDPMRRHGLLDIVDPADLRILDETLLEAALDASDLVRALEDGCQQPLHGLLHEFRRLLRDPDLPPAQLPIGPRVLGQALAQALGEYPSGRAPKLKVLQALALHLPALLQPLYRDLLSHIGGQLSQAEAPTIVLDGLPELPEPALPDADKMSGDGGVTAVAATALEPDDPARVQASPDPSPSRAREEVAARLARHPMPEAVRHFLRQYWQAWLEDCHRRHGADSLAWQTALQTMDEVVLALSPQPMRSAQSRLRRLPALLGRLRAGMVAVGIPTEARERFLVQWMQAQAKLLDAGQTACVATGQTEGSVTSDRIPEDPTGPRPQTGRADAGRPAGRQGDDVGRRAEARPTARPTSDLPPAPPSPPSVSATPPGAGLGAAEPGVFPSPVHWAVRSR